MTSIFKRCSYGRNRLTCFCDYLITESSIKEGGVLRLSGCVRKKRSVIENMPFSFFILLFFFFLNAFSMFHLRSVPVRVVEFQSPQSRPNDFRRARVDHGKE